MSGLGLSKGTYLLQKESFSNKCYLELLYKTYFWLVSILSRQVGTIPSLAKMHLTRSQSASLQLIDASSSRMFSKVNNIYCAQHFM